MQVQSVVLDNYGAFYGCHEFRVADRGLVLVQGRNLDEPRMNSNGAAKSTLFEAIDWALFGTVPKGDHADSVIHDEADRCDVLVRVRSDDGVEGEIQRSRPADLRFTLGGRQLTACDTRETQRLINRWLGLDRAVFHAAVFFGQQDLRKFADSTDSQRMEILSSIFPELGEVDDLQARAKQHRAKLSDSLDALTAQVGTISGEISGIESLNFEEQIREWDESHTMDLRGLTAQLEAKEHQLWGAQERAEKRPQLQARIDEIQKVPLEPVPDTVEGLQEVRQLLTADRHKIAIAENDVGVRLAEIRQIQSTGVGRCSKCGSVVDAEHLREEVERLHREYRAIEERRVRLREGQSQLMAGEARLLEKLEQERARVMRQHQGKAERQASLFVELERARSAYSEAQQLQREIQQLTERVQRKQSEVNPVRVQAQQTEARLMGLRVAWREAMGRETQARSQLHHADFWVRGFSAAGLKSFILDTKLQQLTDAANEWVKLLTAGTFWVRFESQKVGRTSKTLRNAPTIRVFRYHQDGRVTERNYKSWSGGEKQRVSWAVDFGLSRLVARRAAKKWDLLVLDEVFKHVDSKGGEAVVDMLRQLQHEKSSVFVIEHDSEFQSHFEQVITVKKERGRSSVEETNGHERQAQIQPGRDDQKPSGEPEAKSEAEPKKQASGGGVSLGTDV